MKIRHRTIFTDANEPRTSPRLLAYKVPPYSNPKAQTTMETPKVTTPNDRLGITQPSIREILAPVHTEGRALPDTDEELDALFESAREEVRKLKQVASRVHDSDTQ